MGRYDLLFVLPLFTTLGCTALFPDRLADSEARQHISLAKSFEQGSELKEATLEYTFVAENYPSTRYFAEAVHKAALLYSMPSNPAANESAALRWLQTYLTLPIPDREKSRVRLHIALLEQTLSLKDSISRERSLRDKQIQDLEAALRRVTQELEELKRVDAQTSKSRIRK